jgi:RNA polymerase sigma-70 factor (ECF subfamily)
VTTRWSVVLAAQQSESADADTALEALCHAYWQPLYAYARRRGHSPHDAEDLTQGFFARLLEKEYLRSVHRDKGRFRQFLLMAFKRFLANEWDRSRRLKRGSLQTLIPIDGAFAERLYQTEDAAQNGSAELAFERRWALSLLDRALSRLKAEFEKSGKGSEFALLKSSLELQRDTMAYAKFAAALGVTEGAVRVAVHRLRKRFRQIFREEVAQTVENESAVDDEVRHLIAALTR